MPIVGLTTLYFLASVKKKIMVPNCSSQYSQLTIGMILFLIGLPFIFVGLSSGVKIEAYGTGNW